MDEKEISWKRLLRNYIQAHMSSLWWLSSLCALRKAVHCLWGAWILTSALSDGLCNPPESSQEGQRVLVPPQTLCWWKLYHPSSPTRPHSVSLSVCLSQTHTQTKTWSECEHEVQKIFQVICLFQEVNTWKNILRVYSKRFCWLKQKIRLNNLYYKLSHEEMKFKNEVCCFFTQWSTCLPIVSVTVRLSGPQLAGQIHAFYDALWLQARPMAMRLMLITWDITCC